jgi:glycosyltransferase involved in cell wall biosynthesis
MSTPVAFLIPVRDGARWLGQAVGSALAECSSDDTVVVIDDGSTDDPASVLPRDSRVRLVSQPPRGIVAALEHGRSLIEAPYVARLDCDDLVLPGRIAAQRAALDADPRLAAVGGRARTDGLPEGMRRYVEWVNGLTDLHREILVESPLFHPGTTLRAEAVAAVGGYRHGDFPEDYDLWLRLARGGWRLGAVDREVVAWRDRPGRLTRTDPRYARAAFRDIKRAYVADIVLGAGSGSRRAAPGASRVAVWGAGQEGTPWIAWLRERGLDVVAALDLKHGGTRHGVPILPREAIATLTFDRLIVAVGARGARDEIRGRIAAARPELVEGRDWWAVA